MKTRNLFAATLAAVSLSASLGAFAQNSTATPYRYGLPLDMVKVIAIDVPASPQCEVVTAKMTYRNGTGAVEVLAYQQLSSACSNQS
jgi:hypothetical protein